MKGDHGKAWVGEVGGKKSGGGGELGCFSRERSWRGDAALLPAGPSGRLLLLSVLLPLQHGTAYVPAAAKQKRVQAECGRDKVERLLFFFKERNETYITGQPEV